MKYQVVRCTDVELMRFLNSRLFPDEFFEGPEAGNQYWVAREVHSQHPVGFCSVRPFTGSAVFMSRAGVMPEARGSYLHIRMIKARANWARAQGYSTAVTYCAPFNIKSAVNLQHAGFTLFIPEWRWAGTEKLYWIKDLTK